LRPRTQTWRWSSASAGPDVRGARHAGVVDVNNAPVEALLELPGVDATLAQRIVDVRQDINGFSSVHDLGHVLELDAHLVERLTDRAVCLPR
jgi:DNA uptake protein ComE-like DNA-binding protein